MYLIAGLGNKGKKFTDTRHNVGFKVIDKIITKYDFEKYKESVNSHTFKGKIFEKKVLLMKPMTYMNNSGKAVSEIVTFYKIPFNKKSREVMSFGSTLRYVFIKFLFKIRSLLSNIKIKLR